MLYIGIDIGKHNHEATILDESGEETCESVKFQNSNSGLEKLLSKIPDLSETTFGLEATGHYWLPIYCELTSRELKVMVLNPIQSNSLRDFYTISSQSHMVCCCFGKEKQSRSG